MVKKKIINTKKKNLCSLFKILYKNNIGDLTANHASILSEEKKGFYINKHNYLFSQVNIRNLQYIDLKSKSHKNYSQVNKAGYYIHKYLYKHNCKYI